MIVLITTLLQAALFAISWFSIFSGCSGLIMCVAYKIFDIDIIRFVLSFLVMGLALRHLSGITLQVRDYDTLVRRYGLVGRLRDTTVRTLRLSMCALICLTLLLSYTPSYSEEENAFLTSAVDGAIASYVVDSKTERMRKLSEQKLLSVTKDGASSSYVGPESYIEEYKDVTKVMHTQRFPLFTVILIIGICDRLLVRRRKFLIYRELLEVYKHGNICT